MPRPPAPQHPSAASRSGARHAVEARRGVQYAYSDAQWAALRSPLRAQVLECLRTKGPMSVAEVAVALDRPADGLYHHLRVLVGSGLARACGARPGPRRPAQLYDASADRLRLDIDVARGRNAGRVVEMMRATLSRAESGFARAIERRAARLEGPLPDSQVVQLTGRLDDRGLEALRSHLRAIEHLFERGRGAPAGRPVCATIVLFPVVRTRGARGAEATPDTRPRGPA